MGPYPNRCPTEKIGQMGSPSHDGKGERRRASQLESDAVVVGAPYVVAICAIGECVARSIACIVGACYMSICAGSNVGCLICGVA